MSRGACTLRNCAVLLVIAMVASVVAFSALAAPDEIQVYLDDVNEPREAGLEMHVNYVLDGPRQPAYSGQMPSHHVLQVTPEFSYGLARNWDAGLYLLSAMGPDGNLYSNGAKVRLK